jgi:ribosomal protein S10
MVLHCGTFGHLSIHKHTLNKSPFVSKKAREQFEVRKYRGLLRTSYRGGLVPALIYSYSLYQDQQSPLKKVELMMRVDILYGSAVA